MAKLILNGVDIGNILIIQTNVDAKFGHHTFPAIFYAIPEIGDYIATTERRDLKVCSRTFGEDGFITIEVTGW
jgi:hypothetical protein